ncbi:hypothetical protein DM860_013406 [Cuscuta australis]|uniref:J domain-containing protein n=1 Tax=Cuscuta australis TaxID=267555 RepID=A0A328DTK9_9ASTE|nr:hypothetical protein DM860_013406 [Cuscuta australis]
MARKGSLQKHGFDSNLGNSRKEPFDSGSAHPYKKQGSNVSEPNVANGEKHLNCNVPRVSLNQELNSSSHPEARTKSKQKHRKSLKNEKRDAVVSKDTENAEVVGEWDSHPHKGEASESREAKEIPSHNDHGSEESDDPKSRHSPSLERTATRETYEYSFVVIFRYLGTIGVSVSKSCIEWIERRKPWIRRLKSIASNASWYARKKVEQAYPVALNWIVNFGKVLLLLSMIWFDCCLRGMGSFLCMGTASLLSIMWWGVLSLIAVSRFKFLLILAGVSTFGLFFGLEIAILTVFVIGVAFLWIYTQIFVAIPVILGGVILSSLKHGRIAMLILTLYSVYCGRTYVGWLGLVLGLNLSFISSDVLVFFLKNNLNEQSSDSSPEQTAGVSADVGGGGGIPSTSVPNLEMTSESEVVRLLNCADHYSALGLSRFQDVDISTLKREYRKKAMLVHPDKNMGNERAADAFKKLQNAYEVLLDSFKRKTYDDELRSEELMNYLHSFRNTPQKNRGRKFMHAEGVGVDIHAESKRIPCKCGKFHLWICTDRAKNKARWCQECEEFHPARDGEGWVEQTSHPFLYGLLMKVETPCAYVCVDRKIYDASEWYSCQGMRCTANSHKPSFHVNPSVILKSSNERRSSSSSSARMPNMEEAATMTEEEFMEWVRSAVQAGLFNTGGSSSEAAPPPPATAETGKGSGGAAGGNKKKKKGKRQW